MPSQDDRDNTASPIVGLVLLLEAKQDLAKWICGNYPDAASEKLQADAPLRSRAHNALASLAAHERKVAREASRLDAIRTTRDSY